MHSLEELGKLKYMNDTNSSLKIVTSTLFDKNNRLADSFFLIQIVAALWFGYEQVSVLLVSVEGASITWMGLWFAFVVINLGLAVGASKKESDRVIIQTIGTYLIWTLVIGLAFFTLLVEGALWNAIDTITAWITGVGMFLLLLYSSYKGLSVLDPIVRGGMGLLFKLVPQLTLAVNIWLHGGKGIAMYTILVGHFIITMRIGQIWMSARRSQWDQNRLGVVVGELGNEISWIVVTIVWFMVAF